MSQRAQARHRDGDLQGAEADYDQAILLNPHLSASYERRATVRQARGDLRAAISDHDRAIALKPTAIKYCVRAKLRTKLGDLRGAVADYDVGIGLDPLFANDHCCRAMLKLKLKDLAGAAEDFQHALALDPQSELGNAGKLALASALGGALEMPLTPRVLLAGCCGQEARSLSVTRM